MRIVTPPRRYNPLAYVRGGAPLAVARATQARGFANPGPRGVPVRPAVRPRIIPTAKPAAAPVDPLWSRANNTVMQFMNPMLARLAAQRVAAEANARKVNPQHVAALQGQLQAGAGRIDESHDRGIVASSAVNDALANRLGAVGGQEQANLTQKLAQIGAADGGEIAKTYQGAANAGFGVGSADLQQLIAERAAGGAYQAKLPGIAALEGNRDLQQALSEMRGEFSEQERGLQDQAAEQSFGLWNTLRGESREDAQQKVAQRAALQEQAIKQKMALQALAATATTAKEKRAFEAQQAAIDRQLKFDIAQLNADTRLATDNPPPKPKPANVVGQPNMAWISVNGQRVKNPNWHGTWEGNTPVPPKKPGSGPQPPKPPSGPQTAVTYNEILKRVFNPSSQRIRDRIGNSKTPDADINREIAAGLKLRKIPWNSEEGRTIRRNIWRQLDGRPILGGTYDSPEWGLGA